MTAEATEDDPAEWSEEQMTNEALMMLMRDFPQYSSLIACFVWRGICKKSLRIVIETREAIGAKMFSNGTPFHERLEQIIEKPVDVVYLGK